MAVTVLYFARLREELGREGDQPELPGDEVTVAGLWEYLHGEPPPPRLMSAVNQHRAGLDAPVRDGDEVAFFPPVTGG